MRNLVRPLLRAMHHLHTIANHSTEADDKDAIDKGNVLKERTRGAAKSSGTYQEPGDEEGLPGAEDGTSRITGSGV